MVLENFLKKSRRVTKIASLEILTKRAYGQGVSALKNGDGSVSKCMCLEW